MALAPGDQIGQYTIQGSLGSGGMASVYRAWHARLERFVAIKVIHADSDPAFLLRFEREARIVASLDHPNIVPVYDFADHAGQPYLVMKMIDGATLRAILSDGMLEVSDIFQIITPLAAALDYAHARGVLHRDIKPSNILLDKAAVPYISDFGLARITQSEDSSMSAGMVLGTPHYISPEQVLGKPIDHRADLYSFAVMLYEMVVGQLPFNSGTPYSILQDHVAKALPMPSSVNPSLPIEVEIVLMRALSKDPEDRYSSASALTTALSNALSGHEGSRAPINAARQGLEQSITKHWIVFDEKPISPSQLITQTPLTGATMQAGYAAPTQMAPAERRTWLIGAIAIAAVSSMVVAALIFLAFQRNPANTPATPLPGADLVVPPQGPANNARQPIPRLDFPTLSLADAQAAAEAAPDDASAFLALAQALIREGQFPEAESAIEAGEVVAASPVSFLLTAGDMAVREGFLTGATLWYADALRTPDPSVTIDQVRGEVNQAIYYLADHAADLTSQEIEVISNRMGNRPSLIETLLIARLNLVRGDTVSAQIHLDRAILVDRRMPDVRLVQGEILVAQGDVEGARAQFEFLVSSSAPVPEWIVRRAQELLNLLPPSN